MALIKKLNLTTLPEKIQTFEDIEVSTKTIIAMGNLSINIEKLFEHLPITPYVIVPKKRGRKRKEVMEIPNNDISSGSIITLKYMDNLRGVDLKKRKASKKGKKKYFRNAVTVVMYVVNKFINFKISKNGKFQLTGCKKEFHAHKCIEYIWKHMENIGKNEQIYSITNDETYPRIIFNTVMTNIDFNLGFEVNRENLDRHINQQTEYRSLLETSFGYTGVNIKFPMDQTRDIKLILREFKDGKWSTEETGYKTYLNMLTDKERQRELNKQRYNTFLVFHSGNVIMSGRHVDYMKPQFYRFLKIIDKCKNIIEEKLDI
uniref:Transcription factor TFIID n=1 Tax=Iridovirus LCIVAC01 TaxID=2506607 RepID=A0A481YQY4_9VIRU|nr:MAG: transcription factor TFIID [Iridovirus LCIVAC01]